MKRTHLRHVHARPDEHIRVHRARPVTPPPRAAHLPGVLLGSLGPVGTLVAGAVAVWAAFKLLVFLLGLVVALLKALCVVVAVFCVLRLFTA